jgi:hypothetical protein
LRQPIAVEVASFDLKKTESQINSAVKAFAEYLAQIPRTKNTRSKYGLLGPAGKAITELKAGRHHRDSLIGYTLRTQESIRGQFAPDPSLTAISALEHAVDQILDALVNTPEPLHATVLDRLDYGLFYRLRLAQSQNKEEARQNWITYLENKYTTVQALSQSWGREIADMRTLVLPSKHPKGHKRSKAEQADVEEFYPTRASATSDEED